MIKNFFEYVKELIPEKGSILFTRETHDPLNMFSLYQLADLLLGKKVKYAFEVTGYSWHVEPIFNYNFPVIGLFVLKRKDGLSDEPVERWIHFSQHAFIGAICIVATKNDITFDDPEFESLRQVWQRKIENKEQEEDKIYTEATESNFDDNWFYLLVRSNEEETTEEDFIDLYKKNPSLIDRYPNSLREKY